MIVGLTSHTAIILLAIAPVWLLVGFLIGQKTKK